MRASGPACVAAEAAGRTEKVSVTTAVCVALGRPQAPSGAHLSVREALTAPVSVAATSSTEPGTSSQPSIDEDAATEKDIVVPPVPPTEPPSVVSFPFTTQP